MTTLDFRGSGSAAQSGDSGTRDVLKQASNFGEEGEQRPDRRLDEATSKAQD
jgi:hypothetical protein